MLKLLARCLLALACLMAAPALSARTGKATIVAVYAKTGSLYEQASSQGHVDGMRLAVDELNQHGGLLGKPVELVLMDSRSTALGAREAARAIVKLRPLGVIGEQASSLSLAMASVLQPAHILMISPKSTHPSLTAQGDYVFRVCYQDAAQGQALADFAREQLKAGSAVVLVNASQKFSVELSRHFVARFKSRGGNVSLEQDYLSDTDDFGPIVEATRKLTPDIVFVPGYAKDAGVLIKRLRAGGVKAVFLGGDGWGMRLPAYAGAAADGAYRSAHWHRDAPDKASQAFVAAYEKRYGTIQSEAGALTYDAVQMLAAAVRRANSLEPELVRKALAETRNFAGVTGNITLDAMRNPIKPVVILQWSGGRDGFVRSVTP